MNTGDEQHIREAFYVAGLISKYQQGQLSGEEAAWLEDWKNRSPQNRQLFDESLDKSRLGESLLELEDYDTHQIAADLFRSTGIPARELPRASGKVVGLFRRYWAAAAVALVLVSAGGYYAWRQQPANTVVAQQDTTSLEPGRNTAVLITGNGELTLDDAPLGALTLEDSSRVRKPGSGQLVYDDAAADNEFHILKTPRGGQFTVTLSDGTKVMLNSASSIRYPVAFNGNERSVSITGEVYFEVAHEKRPFNVGVGGGTIRVLGTHFNVMSYEDEPFVKATLVEGSIRLDAPSGQRMIRPGEQASFTAAGQDIRVQPADVDEVLAWTRDEFLFKSQNIKTIMRQIARWYDADVVYNGDLSDINFSGGMSRKENVAHLIELLQADGRLTFSIRGKQLTVARKQ